MDHSFSDALKTRILVLGMMAFANGFVVVAALPSTPDVARGGTLFAAE